METEQKNANGQVRHLTNGPTSETEHDFQDSDRLKDAAESSEVDALMAEIAWVKELIAFRTRPQQESAPDLLPEKPLLNSGRYAQLIETYGLNEAERVVLGLCLLTCCQPEWLEPFLFANPETNSRHRKYGGVLNRSNQSFQPTLRTAIFLLAGDDGANFIYYQNKLRSRSSLFREQIVNLYGPDPLDTYLPNAVIKLDSAYVDYLFAGEALRLDAGDNFPAKLLETTKTFKDLVLKPAVMDKLKPALNYVRVQQQLYTDPQVSHKIKKGFIMLLYGPPGTGKTLTASIIGNELNTPVYQIDSSLVVSKYIGETEKNLERVFSRLEGKNCILFFDEADSLFGKRTEVMDARDRYANQGVSYLLQRIETFDGLVILATNYQQNFDDAFKRRILTKVSIAPPDPEERIQLWHNALPEGYTFSSQELVEQLAHQYEFTGANIAAVVKMSVEHSFAQNTRQLTGEVLAAFVFIVGREVFGSSFRPFTFTNTAI